MRDRDLIDFDHIAPRLDVDARAWLLDALVRTMPNHVWAGKSGELSR